MAIHWVNYDLLKSGQNYEGLIDYLKSHLSWARPVASSYFVQTTLSAAQLRDGIMQHVDGNDRVLVVEVQAPTYWAGLNLPKDVVDWLNSRF